MAKKNASSSGPVPSTAPVEVERVQTGVRLEKRLVKVLKGVAEAHDQTLGELLEEMALHALIGECAFGPESLKRIAALKQVYGLDYEVHASYRFAEPEAPAAAGGGRGSRRRA